MRQRPRRPSKLAASGSCSDAMAPGVHMHTCAYNIYAETAAASENNWPSSAVFGFFRRLTSSSSKSGRSHILRNSSYAYICLGLPRSCRLSFTEQQWSLSDQTAREAADVHDATTMWKS
eukprot:scaffold158677_cov16-Prasinocladus_malaysianus.AAC.1